MMRVRSILLAGTVAFGLLLSASPSDADIPVIDISNLTQNILTAARALEEINNQVTQIQQFVQMLENQARNLASLNISDLTSLNADLSNIQLLMSQAQGLVYNVDRSVQQFSQFYPQQYGAAVTADQVYQDAHARWLNSVEAFQQSVQAQSRIVSDIATDQQNMTLAVTASQGAVGILQATQAGNQLIALQVKQTSELQAMLAAHARAQDLELARQAEAEETARVQRQQFLGDGVHYTPQPVQVFH
jgi:P-type conjugative transfer protein TrbJ